MPESHGVEFASTHSPLLTDTFRRIGATVPYHPLWNALRPRNEPGE